MSAGNPPVDMEAMYQFFVGLMQAGVVAGVVGNVGGANPMAPVGNNYALLSRDYTSLGGKPFLGTESAIEVQNWRLHCKRIFTDLGLNDGQKRRLASRQLQGSALHWWNSVTTRVSKEQLTWADFKMRFE